MEKTKRAASKLKQHARTTASTTAAARLAGAGGGALRTPGIRAEAGGEKGRAAAGAVGGCKVAGESAQRRRRRHADESLLSIPLVRVPLVKSSRPTRLSLC